MNPIIKKIEFTAQEQDEIDRIKKGEAVPKVKTIINKNGSTYDVTFNKRFSYELGRKRLIELYGGVCISCGKWPNYKVTYDVSDPKQQAKLIQRYCQTCFEKWEDRLWKN